MALTLIGKKKGMTQIFDKEGKAIPCTAILVEPNVVIQIKKSETDGYTALQLGGVPLSEARTRGQTKPIRGHQAKVGEQGYEQMKESRLEAVDAYEVGQKIDLSAFQEFRYVDVQSVSKGKGFQGVMKLFGFAGGPGAHGSGFHRHAGSTGQRSTPGRCFPNGKRASRMGGDLCKVQNLKVVEIRGNWLLVEGAVPGSDESVVYISQARRG